MERVDIRVTSF
jgi:hypothetical protein